MGASLIIGFILGALLGAATGTGFGMFIGGVAGMAIALPSYGIIWMLVHSGSHPTVERHLVMCTPFGQTAECEFVGDVDTGHWYDVKSCSLLARPDHVDCDKGCMRLIGATGVRPGRACKDCK